MGSIGENRSFLWYNRIFSAAGSVYFAAFAAEGRTRAAPRYLAQAGALRHCGMLDINQIREILPHRYPMLLVDRILEMAEDRIVGLKDRKSVV